MKYKVLLVDDEKDIVEFLSYNLNQEGFEVIVAYDGEEAISKMKENPNLVILDVMMPKLDGFEVCRKIRHLKEFENIPVIFLTAKVAESDEVRGLELGANDFIHKPISPKKLIARVRSNLRKIEPEFIAAKITNITIGPLNINKIKYVVNIGSNEIVFPKKEFELLFFLASNPGKVFGRDVLLKEVWGTDVYVVDRTVDVHIRKIREKLSDHSDIIETVKGVGYRFKEF
ncbi:MAG TPA: response regulator transcription factor [Ignavibacteriaceae bacterium]|nr:response regulator transcription factor [Ignavibacteriaceae bacterium]